MNKVLIVLLSSTSAFSMKTMLETRYKIHSRIIQAPAKLAYLGCTYCIELDASDMKTAVNLLRVSGVSSKGIYNADTYEKIL
ncbi:MAG: DUF3343 domain-containing protein [Clostridia bacterium]|nr:DUF3343 domain-containing protein [Clostridia bacterium]